MGRSLRPIAEVARLQDYSENAHNPFEANGSRFRIDRDGDRVSHHETRTGAGGKVLYEHSMPADYAVGSGSSGYSYLTVRDSCVLQTPVSWYSQKGIWDRSPGFSFPLHAGRPVVAGCLFCHANRVEPVEGSLNRYVEPVFRGHAIGCERCHGPGEAHVRLRETGQAVDGVDYSIVNPRHLDPALRESVCQQCHLEGEARVVRHGRGMFDFRPGLPLSDFWAVLAHPHEGEDRKAVNHVEQMYLSRCFTASGGKLGCVSCHDPHEPVKPERRVGWYRDACLKCHDCTTPVAERSARNGNSCVDCHMPRFSSENIAHTAATDHRIVRRPVKDMPGKNVFDEPAAPVFFPRRVPDRRDPLDCRDYGIGLVRMAASQKLAPAAASRQALPLLEKAIAALGWDADLWEHKAIALETMNRLTEALAACESVLANSPRHERVLLQAARLAERLGRRDEALQFWRRAADLNPGRAEPHEATAWLLAGRGDWDGALAECRRVLELNPGSAHARAVRAYWHLAAGRPAEADSAFQEIEAIRPPELPSLRAWYARQKKSPR